MKSNNLYTLLQNTILTSEPLIHPLIAPPIKGSVADRVAIYANGYYLRLEETLISDYGSLCAIMGEQHFARLSKLYADSYPSSNYSLNFFGRDLVQFLKTTSPYLKKPYLAEIASFEWAESQAMIAQDAVLLTVADLQSLPVNDWPEQVFYLHPSCTILTMNWNSLAMIEAIRNEKHLPSPKKLKTQQNIILWRRECDVRYCKLKYLDFILLQAAQSKRTFLQICELLSTKMSTEQAPNVLVQALHDWLQEKLFVDRL